MPGSVVEDVKQGIKGVRGAGDALRGELLNATDRAFDSDNSHPETAAAREKNSGIAARGKQDVGAADEMIARREAEKAAAGHGGTGGVAREGAAPRQP